MSCKIEVTIITKRVEGASKRLPIGIRDMARRWEEREAMMIEEVIIRECAKGLPSLNRTDLLNRHYLKAKIPRISMSWTIYFSPLKQDQIVRS